MGLDVPIHPSIPSPLILLGYKTELRVVVAVVLWFHVLDVYLYPDVRDLTDDRLDCLVHMAQKF